MASRQSLEDDKSDLITRTTTTTTNMTEPLFDLTLRKRKKKQVAFSEDPLGADADPTTPAPVIIDNVATNGDTIDMGPKTVHEQMAQNGRPTEGAEENGKVDDEFKAMFGDLKKKKKKKDIPLDLVCTHSHICRCSIYSLIAARRGFRNFNASC